MLTVLKSLRLRVRRSLGVPSDFEEQVYSSVVAPGDTVYDIGAHDGAVAKWLARMAGPAGSIFAFEPVWPLYLRLCGRARRKGPRSAPVIPVPLGFSDSQGLQNVSVPGEQLSRGSLAPASAWALAQASDSMLCYTCVIGVLDDFIAAQRLPAPEVVKIDVEGAESLVLAGASKLLESAHPLLIVEIFAPWSRAFGRTPWDALKPLVRNGYEILYMCPEGLVPHIPTHAHPMPAQYQRGYNVVAYVPELHERRIQRLAPLRAGSGGRVLAMPEAPIPNKMSSCPGD